MKSRHVIRNGWGNETRNNSVLNRRRSRCVLAVGAAHPRPDEAFGRRAGVHPLNIARNPISEGRPRFLGNRSFGLCLRTPSDPGFLSFRRVCGLWVILRITAPPPLRAGGARKAERRRRGPPHLAEAPQATVAHFCAASMFFDAPKVSRQRGARGDAAPIDGEGSRDASPRHAHCPRGFDKKIKKSGVSGPGGAFGSILDFGARGMRGNRGRRDPVGGRRLRRPVR